ncbi:TPA: rhodanese-like domain-containing protein [Streptococcus suis]
MQEKHEQTITLTATELLGLIQTESVQLLDVRDPEEHSAGHIGGAINCPMDRIAAFDGPVDQHYLLICKSGKRSKLACHLRDLRQMILQVAWMLGTD